MKRLILALLASVAFAASSPVYAAVKTVVLVRGAFADGSGWKPVAAWRDRGLARRAADRLADLKVQQANVEA
jgi:hypothetical protein